VRRVAAHVFVEDVEVPALNLRDADFHHLSRVLRLRPGEAVSASDGAGRSLACRWTGARALEPASEISYQGRPWPPLTVAFALTKGEHPEWTVQKLTEAGVDRVIVMTTAHCVARWGAGDPPRRLARLKEVARQAAMQSRRVWLPSVEGPLTFSQVVSVGSQVVSVGSQVDPVGSQVDPVGSQVVSVGSQVDPVGSQVVPVGRVATEGESGDPRAGAAGQAGVVPGAAGVVPGAAGVVPGVALAVPDGSPLSLATPSVLVGPEGGWSEAELGAVVNHVALGPHVLRAETAALAAGVLLAALRSHLVAGVHQAPATRSCR
jgi:16S rRNA (uracil1498-N3)-methyltransferase